MSASLGFRIIAELRKLGHEVHLFVGLGLQGLTEQLNMLSLAWTLSNILAFLHSIIFKSDPSYLLPFSQKSILAYGFSLIVLHGLALSSLSMRLCPFLFNPFLSSLVVAFLLKFCG